jgi:PAS domain S-box-containing protein
MSVQRLPVEPMPKQAVEPELSADVCRAFIRCNPDGVLILDAAGDIRFINPNGVDLLGLADAASVLGGAWTSLWPLHERAKALAAIRAARQGETARFEGFCPTAAEARKWWDVVVSPFETDASDAQACGGFLCVVRDITSLKLAHETSARSQRLEALGEFTGGVAHDFNNLLTIIMGATETLAEALDGQPDDQDLALVSLRAAEQGAGQIRRLLAFARRDPLAPETVDGGAMLESLGVMVSHLLPGDITLQVSTPAAPLHCLADRGELEAAILNLCVNSRDAMPTGGTLTLATDAIEVAGDNAEALGLSPGAYAAFTVRDDGVGMSAETLRRAVEPFFTTKAAVGGTGLGLSGIHSFARRSGGRLTITSAPGQGATVRLFMPRARAAQPLPAAAECPASLQPMTAND